VFPPNLIAQKSCYGRTLGFEVWKCLPSLTEENYSVLSKDEIIIMLIQQGFKSYF
jgi:hypothetical protein